MNSWKFKFENIRQKKKKTSIESKIESSSQVSSNPHGTRYGHYWILFLIWSYFLSCQSIKFLILRIFPVPLILFMTPIIYDVMSFFLFDFRTIPAKYTLCVFIIPWHLPWLYDSFVLTALERHFIYCKNSMLLFFRKFH